MEEKKTIKISLSTFFLLIAIIIICIMGYFLYKMNSDKSAETNKTAEIQNEVNGEINAVNENKTNNISNTINNNESTNTEQKTKIICDIADGDDVIWPTIYMDENGYVYYNSNYNNVTNKEIEYKKIYDKNNNAVKANMIILQFPTTHNQIDPNITCTYTFLTDSKVYQFNYYYDNTEGKEIFSKNAEIKYNEAMPNYKFLEVKDQYSGHTINMSLSSINKNEQKLVDIVLAYDVKTKTNLIADSWHMNLEQDN